MTSLQIDPQVLAEVENLQLTARHVAQGALAGIHRSLRRGTSIEFSEHKRYTPGDDVRHVDWRAYAKTDRFHVKQFEDETNLRVELLLDHSQSMDFSTESWPSKLEFARTVASALAYLALRQGDATGLTTFAAEVTTELPPRASSAHLVEILTRLVQVKVQGTTGIAPSIDHFAQSRRRRSVAIIFSDLFDPNPELLPAMRRLVARRHDVVCFHILDPAEIDFPYEDPATFHAMEDSRRLFVHPRTLRAAYVSEMKKFLETTERHMAEAHIDYQRVTTDSLPAHALARFIRARQTR